MAEIDPHGQPFNVKFNRARRAERDLCELLGLARGLLADGVVTADEATLLHEWVARHEDALDHWAVRTVHNRLTAHFEDGSVMTSSTNRRPTGRLMGPTTTRRAPVFPWKKPDSGSGSAR